MFPTKAAVKGIRRRPTKEDVQPSHQHPPRVIEICETVFLISIPICSIKIEKLLCWLGTQLIALFFMFAPEYTAGPSQGGGWGAPPNIWQIS